jgi:maleylpyruvate isomerase
VLTLYSYFRSSAAFRARIALNLKGLDYEQRYVHLSRGGGEQFHPDFRKINPQALVPALDDGGAIVTQSLAMIEYLDEAYPEMPLLPPTALERARVRALALSIACEIHPLNNLRVLNFLTRDLKLSEEDKLRWYKHWIATGFAALEESLATNKATGVYCHGDRPTLADVCLVPQVANARRFNCDLAPYPTVVRIDEACLKLDAFIKAKPENQADRE